MNPRNTAIIHLSQQSGQTRPADGRAAVG